MISVNPTIFYTLIEISAVLAVLCLVFAFLILRGRKQHKQALEQLVEKVKEGEASRKEKITAFLKKHGHEDDEELDKVTGNLIQKENDFYHYIISALLARNVQPLFELDQHLEALAQSYSDLVKGAAGNESGADTIDTDDLKQLIAETSAMKSEMTSLREENAKLATELDESKKEMKQTLTEFTSAFSGAAGAPSSPSPQPPAAEEPMAEEQDETPPADETIEIASEEESSAGDNQSGLDEIAEIPDDLLDSDFSDTPGDTEAIELSSVEPAQDAEIVDELAENQPDAAIMTSEAESETGETDIAGDKEVELETQGAVSDNELDSLENSPSAEESGDAGAKDEAELSLESIVDSNTDTGESEQVESAPEPANGDRLRDATLDLDAELETTNESVELFSENAEEPDATATENTEQNAQEEEQKADAGQQIPDELIHDLDELLK
jgi:hypothetical protein